MGDCVGEKEWEERCNKGGGLVKGIQVGEDIL